MNFQLTALPEKPFQHLFSLSDAQLQERNIVSKLVTEKHATPCRISLEDADIGDKVLLVNYQHLPDSSPFQASHAIYIRENAKQASPQKNKIPQMISKRIISLRAFDKQHMMINADLAQGTDIAATILDMLNDRATEYIHLHFAKQGCYAAKVNRV
ncbi:MAG: DUF1203 domain-containing protein [Oceanospirillaceae bacterium]